MDLLSIDTLIALFTLTILEIVLGIDNIIFISIVSNKLPEEQRAKTRNIGLVLALVFRVAMLFGITWIMGLTASLIDFELWSLKVNFSGRDLILLIGGLFLIAKSTAEIHHKMEGDTEEEQKNKAVVSISKTILQIVALDIIFSFDSILTAVGLTQDVGIMIAAVLISMGIMMIFAGKISKFINDRPTLQVLALSFLILIGFMLLLEAFHVEVPKGYIYFAVCYALIVEVINMRMKKKKLKKK
ncbi:MAG: putative tellurium resistance membrane protein TerC [Glaciecola sp.]|jgi:predicted tellurium resistance membrane protein TerC